MKYLFIALTVLFVYLKLTHAIDWSWWMVFAPLYGGMMLTWAAIFFSVVYLAYWGTPEQKLAVRLKYGGGK